MRTDSLPLNMAKVNEIDIYFENISYEISGYKKKMKQILKGLSGHFRAGELTAIMGPSGAGKSTLLNILSGFQEGKYKGTIEYVGNDGKQSWDTYKKQSCYIQQSDYLHENFTVSEIMTITTYLKIDQSVTHKFREILIDNILDALHLSKTKNIKVERISKGEKKRLSIALELIDNLPVMFLDEPTTGLDSLSTLQCMTALQSLVKSGRTLICTIHQPSAALYQMFDYVYLMADGYCMYVGTPDNTVHYFSQQGLQCPKYHNPADYMLEVVNKEYGDYNQQLKVAALKCTQREDVRAAKTENTTEKTLDVTNHMTLQINPPSEIARFWVLFYRCVMQLHRDWVGTHMKLVLHFLVAVLLGLMFERAGEDASKTINNFGFLMITVLYLYYTSMMPAVLKFPLELAILKKERFNNWYQLRTYYIALLVTNLPMQITYAFIYTTVTYLMNGQPREWTRYLMFLLITSLTTIISESMGLGLGAVLNPINGTFCGSILVSVMLALTGFLAFFRHMPVVFYYVSYMNCFRYAFDGLVQAVYNNRNKLECPSHKIYCHYRIPSVLMEEMSLNKPTYWIDVIVLFLHIVVFRLVAYKMLKKTLSKM